MYKEKNIFLWEVYLYKTIKLKGDRKQEVDGSLVSSLVLQ